MWPFLAHGKVASACCYTHTCLDFFVDFQLLGFVCWNAAEGIPKPSQTPNRKSSKKDSSNIIQHVETKNTFPIFWVLNYDYKNHTKTKSVSRVPTLVKNPRLPVVLPLPVAMGFPKRRTFPLRLPGRRGVVQQRYGWKLVSCHAADEWSCGPTAVQHGGGPCSHRWHGQVNDGSEWEKGMICR